MTKERRTRLEAVSAIEPSRKIWRRCKAYLLYPDGSYKQTDASGVFIDLGKGRDFTVYFDERSEGEGVSIMSLAANDSPCAHLEIHPAGGNWILLNAIAPSRGPT